MYAFGVGSTVDLPNFSVVVAGLEGIAIGETLADPENPVALPIIRIEEPTVRMTFGVNTSPFSGREGRWGTSRKLRERLFDEVRNNVALRVAETATADTFLVSGRGELHLAILIETMRREGYEFQVSRPEVIFHKAVDGSLLEPYEEVHIETSTETVGAVVEMLGARRGQMMDMQDTGQGTTRLTYIAPTRGLLGFRYQFLTSTRGAGVMHTVFSGYDEMAGPMATRSSGSIVAMEAGETTAYALKSAEERGTLFYGPGVSVYEGMVVGEASRGQDIPINVCRKKHLTNVRSSRGDMEIRLTPPRPLTLESALEFIAAEPLSRRRIALEKVGAHLTAFVLAMAGLDYSHVREPDYDPAALRQSVEIIDDPGIGRTGGCDDREKSFSFFRGKTVDRGREIRPFESLFCRHKYDVGINYFCHRLDR